jgi:acyl carrier protein
VTDSVNARLAAIFCELLQIGPDELSDSTSPADAPLWDSLNHLNLVTAAEKEFGIRLSMKEVRAISTFGAARDTIAMHVEEQT